MLLASFLFLEVTLIFWFCTELEIDVSKYALQNTTEDLQIKYVPFNEIIEIFSVLSEVALSKHSTTKSETLMCILLFINQTGNVILKSNVM